MSHGVDLPSIVIIMYYWAKVSTEIMTDVGIYNTYKLLLDERSEGLAITL